MNCFRNIFLLIILILNISNIYSDEYVLQIKKLRTELLETRKYDKWSRPVKQYRTPTYLKLSISVTHISDLDIVKHVLTTEAWLRMTWIDEHLTWNPNDFGGLKEIHFGADELWRPDITLWNSADHLNLDENLAKAHLIVSSNGSVYWMTAGTFKTACEVDLTDFPYDKQNCPIYFGSWSHNEEQINITTLGWEFLESGPWMNNPEWDITNINSFSNSYDYPDYGVYKSLVVKISLKRNTSFYYYIITLPSIASMLLILAIFWLPSHSSARFTLGSISLFISLSTLFYFGLQLGSASLGVPYAVRNLSLLVIMVGIALTLSTLSQHIFFACLNSNLRIPQFLITLLTGVLANVFCISDNCLNQSKQFTSDRMQLTPEDANDPNFDGSAEQSKTNEKEWKLIFSFVDRLLFLIYSIIFIAKHA